MNNKNKINLNEFNYLRAIGIFLVVFGHSFPYIDEVSLPFYKYIHSLIYSFHMPLFFMISGFFAYKILNIKSYKEYKTFIASKFKKLMIPYLTISFITIPIKFLLNRFSERSISDSNILIDIFLYPWNNPIIFFWFIYVLFLIFIFSPLIVKLNKYVVITIFFILSIIPIKNIQLMGISTIFSYSIYFFIGLYLRDIYINNRSKILNFRFNFLKSVLFILIPLIVFMLNLSISSSNTNLLFSTYLNILFFLKAILGIYLTFILSIIINKFKYIKHLSCALETLSFYSFDIYLLSWFPQIFARILFYQILKLDYNLVVILSLIFGFTPILVSKFIFRKFSFTKKLFLGVN